MKRLAIILVILNLTCNLFSQDRIFTTNYVFLINNYEFGKIISDFIEQEKQYDYFSDNCLFYMQLQETDSTVNFTLNSGTPINQIKDWKFWEEINEKYFVVKFYEYFFLLYSPSGANFTRHNLFIKHNEKHSFRQCIINENISPSKYSYHLIDDSLWESSWLFFFYNGKFYNTHKIYRNYGWSH